MASPSGMAETTVNPKPRTISVSVVIECDHSIGASDTMREKTLPGPGRR